MAKKKHEVGRTITTKSPFGSHEDMVVDHVKYGVDLVPGQVLCKDEDFFYITESNRLDTGLADPHRYSGKGVEVSEID